MDLVKDFRLSIRTSLHLYIVQRVMRLVIDRCSVLNRAYRITFQYHIEIIYQPFRKFNVPSAFFIFVCPKTYLLCYD